MSEQNEAVESGGWCYLVCFFVFVLHCFDVYFFFFLPHLNTTVSIETWYSFRHSETKSCLTRGQRPYQRQQTLDSLCPTLSLQMIRNRFFFFFIPLFDHSIILFYFFLFVCLFIYFLFVDLFHFCFTQTRLAWKCSDWIDYPLCIFRWSRQK